MHVKAVIVPGFRKCGTTSVFDWLSLHSDQFYGNANAKEPQFFANERSDQAIKAWYESLYLGAEGRTILDGSTLMMSDPTSIARALAYYGGAVKFLVAIRDPVKRAYSAYWHMRGKAPTVEKRVFERIMRAIADSRSLDEAIIAERNELGIAVLEQLVESEYAGKDYLTRIIGRELPFKMADPLWMYRYVEETAYSRKIIELENLICASNIKVVCFEQLKEDELLQREVLGFCGLPPEKNFVCFDKVANFNSGAVQPESTWFTSLNGSLMARKISRGLPKSIKLKLKGVLYSEPDPLPENLRLKLRGIFTEEYEYWAHRIPSTKHYWE